MDLGGYESRTMNAKDQIIKLLPSLTARDVQDVRQAMKSLGFTPQAEVRSSDWLLDGYATYLAKRGLVPQNNTIYHLQKRTSYKQYRAKVDDVMSHLAMIESQVKSVTRHRPRLAYLCARSLAELLESWNRFSVANMLTHVDKIPEALTKSYPGYYESGMFSFVLENGEGE
jgi:hypothetical protein